MADASSKTDASLEDLPELKADLEEARQLLSRLEDRKAETDPDRYERLRQRYEEQIEELEPTVEQLVDEGKTRKLELEDRLAHQQDKAQEAKGELEEIESLYEEGAMGEEAYREDRRRLRRQKKEAESKVSEIEREIDEVEFYLTETGEVSYQKEQIRSKAESIISSIRSATVNLVSRIRESSPRLTGTGPAWRGLSSYLPSGKTVVVLLALGAGLFALNWILGTYIASQAEPILQSRIAELEENGDVRVTYGDVGVNLLFRNVSVHGGRVVPGPDAPETNSSALTWEKATLGLSFGMIWKLVRGEQPNTLRSADFTVKEMRLSAALGEVQTQSSTVEFEGLLSRRMFEEEDPRMLLRHPQSISLQLTGLNARARNEVIEEIEFFSRDAVQRLSETSEAQIGFRFKPDQRMIRVQYSITKPKSTTEASGKLEYGFDRYDNFEPRHFQVDGEASIKDIPYDVPDGPRMNISRLTVRTEEPITMAFADEPPFPEGRIVAEIEQRATGGRFERRIRENLQEIGIRPSALREGMSARLDYEYDGNTVTVRRSSLSIGEGTVRIDGKMDVDESGGRFQNMEVRFQELPREARQRIRRRLARNLDQRIPQDGTNLEFRLTGSIEDPTVRSLP
jgi:hypothetical protein